MKSEKSLVEEVEAEINASRAPARRKVLLFAGLVVVAIFLFITLAVMAGNALS